MYVDHSLLASSANGQHTRVVVLYLLSQDTRERFRPMKKAVPSIPYMGLFSRDL